MSDNIVRIPVNMDYAKRGDPTTLAFLRQSAERKEKEAESASTDEHSEIVSGGHASLPNSDG
jgi:hypothetical protein